MFMGVKSEGRRDNEGLTEMQLEGMAFSAVVITYTYRRIFTIWGILQHPNYAVSI